jgi:hypothetical protein
MKARMRRGAAALAMLVALFALARPVCAVQELRTDLPRAPAVALVQEPLQDSDHSVLCCDALEASVVATSSALVAAPAAAVALPVPAFAHVPPRIAPAHPVFGALPPPPLSYHARSARILR